MFKRLSIVAAALALVAAAPETGSAASYDAQLHCLAGHQKWQIDLPLLGSGRYSEFYVSLNGGEWRQVGTLYYTNPYVQLYWDGYARQWLNVNFGSTPVWQEVGANVTVHAYERRYVNSWTWVYLGSCTTSYYGSLGVVFTGG